jgi:hypothetical protein
MKFKSAALLMALPLLAACAPEVESSIYVEDVVKVATETAPLSVPALLRVPQSSAEACAKGLDQLIANLKTLAPTTGKGKCIEKNTGDSTDQLAEIETEMLITRPEISFRPPSLFVLEVAETSASTYDLTFRLTKPIAEIVKALAVDSDELSVDFDPARFIFSLNNDSAGDIEFTPNHVFVDDEPGLPELGAQTLERRKDVEIMFSDVASAYVEKGNGYRFATVTVSQ